MARPSKYQPQASFNLMRKSHVAFKALATGLVVVAVVFTWQLSFRSETAVAKTLSCRVTATVGRNQILSAAGSGAAAIETKIRQSDIVVTGPQGRLRIACSDKSSFVIGAASKVHFEKLTRLGGNASYLVRLARGIAGFVVPLLGKGRFEVHTPNAVASVRSTEWTVEQNGEGTAVFVREGAVQVRGRSARKVAIVLKPGLGIEVAPDGEVGKARAWLPERIDRMKRRLGFEWQ